MSTTIDLSVIKGFKEKAKQKASDIKKQQAIEELNKALEFFSVNELRYNHSVVQFASQIVEDLYGNERNSGDVKRQIVMEVCKKYFNDDLQLVCSILELVYPTIIKTTWYRRNKLKFRNFFFGCLKKSKPKLEANLKIGL